MFQIQTGWPTLFQICWGKHYDAMDYDEATENLDLLLKLMEEQETRKQDERTLGNAFIEDVQERMRQMDTQYLTGLKKIFLQYIWTQSRTQNQQSQLL